MSALISSALTCFVLFLAPALTVQPKLLANPWLAITIPICSVFLLLLSFIPLTELGLLSHEALQACLYLLGLLGAIRVFAWLRANRGRGCHGSDWTADGALSVLLALAFSIFIAGRLSIWGFDIDDEIYSWNKWAVDFFLGNDINFEFTKWPYPLLFPRILNLGYILNGTLEAQTAVKTALAIFPFCATAAIALTSPAQVKRNVWLTILLIALIYVAGAKSSFEVGMPDAMAATSVLLSAMILIDKGRIPLTPNQRYFLAAILATVGVLSKQPSLIWGIVALPVLAVFPGLIHQQRSKGLVLLLLPALAALLWSVTEGSGFHQNDGPVSRSMEDRDFIQQLSHAAMLLVKEYVEFGLVILWSMLSIIRNGRGWPLMVLFVLPATLMWLLLANYDVRAGLSALLVAGFLIALNDFGRAGGEVQNSPPANFGERRGSLKIIFPLICIASVLVVLDISKAKREYPHYEFSNVSINNYLRMFGEDGFLVHNEIRKNPDAVLWTPTPYVYGLFYGYQSVYLPDYRPSWGEVDLISQLRRIGATHATSGGRVSFGPGGSIFNGVLTGSCKSAFEKINTSANGLGISIFRIDQTLLKSANCDL